MKKLLLTLVLAGSLVGCQSYWELFGMQYETEIITEDNINTDYITNLYKKYGIELSQYEIEKTLDNLKNNKKTEYCSERNICVTTISN